jgi:intracellular multiplication protein IcmB
LRAFDHARRRGAQESSLRAVGFQEALRRLSKVFPGGSAQKEVERRRLERLKSGEMEARATESVLEALAAEMIDGRGVALVLRPHDEQTARRTLVEQ